MPVVQPGKHPAKRFSKSKVFGGKFGGGHKETNAEINVVPMVDMMTMLVIFLLQQFSATGEVVYMQKDIKLPEARNVQPIDPAPVVAISAAQVVVSGSKVAEVADLERDSTYLDIPQLEEQLRNAKKSWDVIHQNDPNRDKNWKGDVNIQADRKIAFRLVKRVMYSCNQAGYFNLNFATIPEATKTAAPAEQPH